MREFHIGAPKAEELRDLLAREQVRDALGLDQAIQAGWTVEQVADAFDVDREQAERVHSVVTGAGDPWAHAEPIGPDPVDVPLGPAAEPAQTRVSEATEPAPGVPAEVPARTVELAVAAPVGTLPAALPTPADTRAQPAVEPAPEPVTALPAADVSPEVTPVGHPDTATPPAPRRRAVAWPVILLAAPAFVAVWSGWVGLGGLTGFGVVHPLPGIADSVSLDTAITLPVGVETYAAYALYVWLSGRVPDRARRFARWSAIGSLIVGALGQIAYHLLVAAGVTSAPWQITTAVACLPVAVLGMGAALAHLVREDAR
ncbi:ABC transporter permease [Micromonospora sp. RTGN7]|uniref:ABC transporter permease n=1 Tax=Micromonospora sp. RTGN7 TaxID=3016526 RepID=UPI0039B6EA92